MSPSRRGLRKAVPSIYSSLTQTTILLTADWRLVQSFPKGRTGPGRCNEARPVAGDDRTRRPRRALQAPGQESERHRGPPFRRSRETLGWQRDRVNDRRAAVVGAARGCGLYLRADRDASQIARHRDRSDQLAQVQKDLEAAHFEASALRFRLLEGGAPWVECIPGPNGG
jgi:hypothetical protein